VHPPPNPQQQREEQLRKEEARREEVAKRSVEDQLEAFDAYAFYERLQSWASKPIPQPNVHSVHITPIRTEKVVEQPLPVTGSDLSFIDRLSADCGRLLNLLRALDQRGMECPYIHQQSPGCLQRAIDQCLKLQKAGDEYLKGKGLWSLMARFFRTSHISSVKKNLEFFKNRLEAVQILCRHQEFAQDLQKMKAAITYQTRESLGDALVRMPVRPIRVPSSTPGVMRPRERQVPSQWSRRVDEPMEKSKSDDQSGTVQ
jgi:hypothetical protein